MATDPRLPAELQGLPPLGPAFFARPTLAVAPELLGACLLREWQGQLLVGQVVEVEAYLPEDPASHSHRGRTPRNAAMFGPPGTAYVYRSYGMHWCLNVATEAEGVGAALLLRALAPVQGQATMQALRGGKLPLLQGPGRLCQGLGVDLALNGSPTGEGQALAFLARREAPPVAQGPRVGISKHTEAPWRFAVAGSPWLSGPKLR